MLGALRFEMMQRFLLTICVLLGTVPAAWAQGASTWFLAEGANNAWFTGEVLVANPSAQALEVTVQLLPQPDAVVAQPLTKVFPLPPTSRLTVSLTDDFGLVGSASAQVSAVVAGTSTPADVVVERSMYFPGASRAGGHNASGVVQTAETWILAEGATNAFDTFVLVASPNASETRVRATYLTSTGASLVTEQLAPPNSRVTFWPRAEHPALENAEFSTIVESLTPGNGIVAERAMYFDPPNSFAAGHDALGVPAPSTTWYFAEGNTGGNASVAFETFLLLANQHETPTDVTVTYHLDSGEAPSLVYTVAPRSRYTVWVDAEGALVDSRLRSAAFGISVQATQPIVAERAMYWGTPSAGDPSSAALPWREGHATAGAPARAAKWGFAEGAQDYIDATGARYQTFILLSNPNPTPIAVRATFLRDDGFGIQRETCVPGNGRANIWTTLYPELSNQRFATFVETVATPGGAGSPCPTATAGGELFVAERAMYWGEGFAGGHGNVGTPWPAAIAVPPVPLVATLSAKTSGRLSGGEWVEISVLNAGPDVQVLFGDRPAGALQFDGVNGSGTLLAQTPVRTQATGYGSTGPVSVTVQSTGRTVVAGTFTFTFNVLAFGDSITYGVSNYFIGGQRFPVRIAIPYPLALKTRLQELPQLGAYTYVTNGGWPGENAVTFGEARLPQCLVGGMTACLKPTDSGTGYIESPIPADVVRPYDIVLILEGVNDVRGSTSPSAVKAALQQMTQTAQAHGVPVLMTRLTSYKEGAYDDFEWVDKAQALNQQIWQLTEEMGLWRQSFDGIDMSTDGLHPTLLGYGTMGWQAAARLNALFPSAPTP